MTEPADITPDDSAEVAEYVLGLLPREEAAVLEKRLREEPALAAELVLWQGHFARLAEEEVAPVAPPPELAARIEAQIFPQATRAPFWRRLSVWRGATALSTLAAVGLAAFAILPIAERPGDPVTGIPPGTILMTHLIPAQGSDLGLALTREPDGTLQVRRVAGEMTNGRAQEIWLIVGQDAPVSLGLLDDDPLTTLTPPSEIDRLFGAGAVVAISDEPPGGSPTGAPTGDILAVGELQAL